MRAYEVETDALVKEFKKAVDKRRTAANDVIEAFRKLSATPPPAAAPKPSFRKARKK